MATWAGAIVDGATAQQLTAIAPEHRIEVHSQQTPLFVHAEVGLGSLGPPPFSESVSRELGCTVVGFFVQTTASVEQVEVWTNGKLARRLEYSADEGGWLKLEGSTQPWESTYFFADGEGTEDTSAGPSICTTISARTTSPAIDALVTRTPRQTPWTCSRVARSGG